MEKGDRVSEYILIERIGKGGFGEVWKAKHEILPDKFAAIKIPTDEHYIEQLKSEGILQHALDHPHIVKTHGLSVTSAPPYFVMDLVEGESLRARLEKSGRLPLKETVDIISQVVEALAYAHDNGVTHTDIKPENILVDKDGKAVLTDFGLGRVSQTYSASLALEGSLITKEGHHIAGTLDYMSPEQKQGEEVGPESDVYSLGIVLFEALTGELPQPQDKPGDLVGGIPPFLDHVFARCYTRVGKRYRNAGELVKDIRRYLKGAQAPAGQKASASVVHEPLSGCVVVMSMLVGALAGFAVGYILGHSPIVALAGAGIGLILGARIMRPKYLIITLGGAVVGMVLARNVIGSLIGVIGAEIVATFIEMGRN